MLYLYLDESGDLGFDFFGKKPSNYFTVTVMAVYGYENNRRLIKGTKKTIRRYLAAQSRNELKGSKDSLILKEYFYDQIKEIPFSVYAVTLNKKHVYDKLIKEKSRVYNYMAKMVLQAIPLDKATNRVILVVDRSKSKKEIVDFNNYIVSKLSSMIGPSVPLNIQHHNSTENLGLQAVDLFSWGIFRSYERGDDVWKEVFKSKVLFDGVYIP